MQTDLHWIVIAWLKPPMFVFLHVRTLCDEDYHAIHLVGHVFLARHGKWISDRPQGQRRADFAPGWLWKTLDPDQGQVRFLTLGPSAGTTHLR